MTAKRTDEGGGLRAPDGPRFPGFDVMEQEKYWDPKTAALIRSRMHPSPGLRFFLEHEQHTAAALLDQLLDQQTEPRIPVLEAIDARLADGETDGWHYADMPQDYIVWRRSLAGLDADAHSKHGCGFASCDWDQQRGLLSDLQHRSDSDWHGLIPGQVWGLLLRYACAAFYSHPQAWNEIGFAGPAYPRGYKNAGVARREPFEVADARPADHGRPEDLLPGGRDGSGRDGSGHDGAGPVRR